MTGLLGVWIWPFLVGIAIGDDGQAVPRIETTAEQKRLIAIVKDALAANREDLSRGRMRFHTQVTNPSKPYPAEIEGTVTWKGDDRRWDFKYSDRSKLVQRDHTFTLAESPTLYYMILGERSYGYNPFSNLLQVRRAEESRSFSVAFMVEVVPETFWSNCCPPAVAPRRPWSDFVGTDSPVLQAGSSYRIERDGPDRVRQVFLKPSGYEYDIVFSLAHNGNVVKFRSVAPRGGLSRFMSFDWTNDAKGRSLLQSCDLAQASDGGDEANIDKRVQVTVHEIAVGPETPLPELSLEALKAVIPRDVMVVDNVADRSYPLNPRAVKISDVQRLSEQLRSRGFLKH